MVRKVLDWTDEKMKKVESGETKHPMLKAFGIGVIEGAINVMVIGWPILFITRIMYGKQLKK